MPRMETLDDHGLRFVQRNNRLRAGISMYDKNRAPITAVFSIKTMGRFVNPLPGMREKRVFYNKGFSTIRVLWWKYLGNITYLQARQEIAKMLDMLAVRLNRGEPIIGLRVTLVDWYSGRSIPRSIAKEQWFYDKTCGDTKLDRMRLRGWGIKIDDGRMEYIQHSPKGTNGIPKPLLNNKKNRLRYGHFDDSTPLDGMLEDDLQSVIMRAIRRRVAELPRYLSARGVMLTKVPDALAVRRAVVTLRSGAFLKRVESALNVKYSTDTKWAKQIQRLSAAESLVEDEAYKWIGNEIHTRLLA